MPKFSESPRPESQSFNVAPSLAATQCYAAKMSAVLLKPHEQRLFKVGTNLAISICGKQKTMLAKAIKEKNGGNDMSIWNLLNEMDQLQTQLGELAKSSPFKTWPKAAFLPGISPRRYPMLNIYSDENNVVAEALAPGLDASTITVNAVKNGLTISGEKQKIKTGAEKFHRNERSVGKFTRTIELSTAIEPDKATAEYKNGILKVVLPKSEEAKPRQIKIAVN